MKLRITILKAIYCKGDFMSHKSKKNNVENVVNQKANLNKPCKNHNPNENHNTKKQALGPNTDR